MDMFDLDLGLGSDTGTGLSLDYGLNDGSSSGGNVGAGDEVKVGATRARIHRTGS